MGWLELFWRMLRLRVALLLVLFVILGFSSTYPTELNFIPLILTILAVLLTYIVATCCNDVADYEIDKINHPRSAGRPLARGLTTKNRLIRMAWICGCLAMCIAFFVSLYSGLLVGFLLLLNVVYSLPPIRLSYRIYFVGVTLTMGYAIGPYLLGVIAANSLVVSSSSTLLLLAISAGFWSRINLKDLRDRSGDEAVGKPTILSRYGKPIVITSSFAALLLSSVLFAINDGISLAARFSILVLQLLIFFALWRLLRTVAQTDEQAYIGIAAKLGNGILALLILDLLSRASEVSSLLPVMILSIAFFANSVHLLARPNRVTLGYHG